MVKKLTENPYCLARDIRGIGFKTADAIAMKLGIEKTAMIRVRAGISYALTEAMDEGNCGLPMESWCRRPRSCSMSRRSSSARRSISASGGRGCRVFVSGETLCVPKTSSALIS